MKNAINKLRHKYCYGTFITITLTVCAKKKKAIQQSLRSCTTLSSLMDYNNTTLLVGWIVSILILACVYCIFLSGVYYFCYYNPKNQANYVSIDAEDEALSPNLPFALKFTSMFGLFLFGVLGTMFVIVILVIPTNFLNNYHEDVTVALSGLYIICKYFMYFYFIQKLQFTFVNTFYSLSMCGSSILAILLIFEFIALISGQILEYNQYNLELNDKFVDVSIKNWNSASIIAYFTIDGLFCICTIYLFLIRFYSVCYKQN